MSGGDRARFTVFGASGFIGSALVRHLEGAGYETLSPRRGEELELMVKAKAHGSCGHAVYCVGLTADYKTKPFETVEAHVGLLARILEHTSFESFVYLSSTRLYDSGGRPVGDERDDLVLNPRDPRHVYDLSKGLGEWLCLHTGRQRAHVARLACVYSESLVGENFLHRVIVRARHEKNIDLETSLEFERDYVYLDDVVQLLVAIALEGRRPIYNVASGENLSNRELFALVERHASCRFVVTPPVVPSPVAGSQTIVASLSSPRISIDAMMQDFSFTPSTVAQNMKRLLEQDVLSRRGQDVRKQD